MPAFACNFTRCLLKILPSCISKNCMRLKRFTCDACKVTWKYQAVLFEYTDYVNLFKSGLTTEQAVVKLKLSKPPPTWIENYQYVQQIRKQEQMSSLKDFLRCYNNKDVVPTLEAMQKMIAFYHDKDIDMLKLGCTLPNLSNLFLHKSTDEKIYPFTEGDKDLLDKIREDFVGASSIAFKRKAVVDETFIRKSTNLCKSIVEIDAGQLYTSSMNALEYRFRTSRFTPHKTRHVALKIWSFLIFNERDLIIKFRASTLPADRRKLTASVLMGFVLIAILCLKQWAAFITFVPVKRWAHLSLKKISNVAVGKENSMNWDEAINRRKVPLSLKYGNVSGGDFTRQPLTLSYISERNSLTDDHLQNTNSWRE